MAVLALWESRYGIYYMLLRKLDGYYHYRGNGCKGTLGPVKSDEAAVAIMQARVGPWMERVGPIESPVRVKSGPSYHSGSDYREVVVSFPACSYMLARRVFNRFPEFADFDGRIYRKGRFHAANCTAYYRSKGK